MFQHFTNPATRVLHYAMEETRRVGESEVDTIHLLLGLIQENEGVAAQALQHSGVDLEQVRAGYQRLLGKPGLAKKSPARLVLSPSAKQVMERAIQLAQESSVIDTEHILLALLSDYPREDNAAVKVLVGMGVDPISLREQVQQAMGS